MLARSPTATSHGLAVQVSPSSSSGLGRRPFKAVARVRIPLGARHDSKVLWSSWSARRPVKAEVAGSSPVRTASVSAGQGLARRSARSAIWLRALIPPTARARTSSRSARDRLSRSLHWSSEVRLARLGIMQAFPTPRRREAADVGCTAREKNNLGHDDLPIAGVRQLESATVDTDDGPSSVARVELAGESEIGVDS